MYFTWRQVFHALICIPFLLSKPVSSAPGPQVIERDVCIIGGGSSGTYAAIRLRDLGKTVAVIERKSRLGGHTETYTDPVTGGKVDYGVVIWHDLDIVKKYFARLKVGLTKVPTSASSSVAIYADLRTGRSVQPVDTGNMTTALTAYAAQLLKYPYLEEGFDIPYPVPSDLLLPFVDFVKKYKLEGMVPLIFQFGQGLGDILHLQTLYVAKNFGLDILRILATGGFLTTASHDNSELYDKAAAVLGDDVNYSSEAVSAKRTTHGVEVTVKSHYGRGNLVIRAKKLLITVPPKPSYLQPFDLDETERSLFSKFGNAGYYTGVMRHTGIADNASVTNEVPQNPYGLPKVPGIYGFSPTGIPGLQNVKYSSPDGKQTDRQVKADIISALKKLQKEGTIPKDAKEPEFAVFSSHTPFELTVSTEEIKSGFYKRLYGLQGRRSTYYTGAAFHTHDSSLLWRFTEGLLKELA